MVREMGRATRSCCLFFVCFFRFVATGFLFLLVCVCGVLGLCVLTSVLVLLLLFLFLRLWFLLLNTGITLAQEKRRTKCAVVTKRTAKESTGSRYIGKQNQVREVWVCVRVCSFACASIRVHARLYARMYVGVCACVYARFFTPALVGVYACIRVQTLLYARVDVDVCACVWRYMRLCIWVYALAFVCL